jgi:hypothetical protein
METSKYFRQVFKFGDKVLNHWAGEGNPRKIGVVIKIGSKELEITDMKGDYWRHEKNDEGLEIIGSVLPFPAPLESKIIEKQDAFLRYLLKYIGGDYQTSERIEKFKSELASLNSGNDKDEPQEQTTDRKIKKYNNMLLFTFSVHDNEDGEDRKDRTYLSLKADDVDEARMKLIEVYDQTISDILFLNNSIPIEIPGFNYPDLSTLAGKQEETNDNENLTYSNIESFQLGFLTDTIYPWDAKKDEFCILCGQKMKIQNKVEYACMNPECECYIKTG